MALMRQFLVVKAGSCFGQKSFRLGRFGLILGWVILVYFGGSFWPNIPPNILYSS